MLDYLPLIWVAVTVVSVVAEAETVSFVPLGFIPSALVSFVISFIGVSEWMQILVFFAMSATLLIIAKVSLCYFWDNSKRSGDDHSPEGEQALVIESIDNLRGKGTVRINGKIWRARSATDVVFVPAGEIVSVSRVDGTVLICE